METPAAIREQSRAVLEDVDPPALRRTAFDAIEESWAGPGVLARRAARQAGTDPAREAVERRAVGAQLVYAGLALTRRLVASEPWEDGAAGAADVEILVADVLVARGTRLLAETEAADRCVEVIRRFGRRETGAVDGGALERDVLELAAVAGSTVDAPAPSPTALAWADELAAAVDGGDYPDVAAVLGAVDASPASRPAVAKEGRQSGTDP